MKKLVLAVAVVCLLVPVAGFAGWDGWEVRSKYRDYFPNDGFRDRGTYGNPYVIERPHQYSSPKFEVKPKYRDYFPNDGFRDPGTRANPWVIERSPW